jgi:hypothetical protein
MCVVTGPPATSSGSMQHSLVRLTPAIEPRRVALLQRRGSYRSAASRAFAVVAQDHASALQD